MKYALCVPVADRLPDIAAAHLQEALSVADFAELRLDYMKPDCIVSFLERVSKHMRRCICTVRSKQEGGRYVGTEKERQRIMCDISRFEPYLQDVELATLQSGTHLQDIPNVMVSWHDFTGSPDTVALRHKFDIMAKYSDTIKMVVTAHTGSDAAAILGLYAIRNQHDLIAFAMGEAARFSRICSVHLGAPFMYVSMHEATAPGQCTLSQIRRLEAAGVI